jgi:[ribosomal protein S18]-alanine N-acetyltransferase
LALKDRTDEDLPACIALLEVVHAFDGYPTTWPADVKSWLTPGGVLHAWVALRGATVVGHVALGTVDQEAEPQLAMAAGRPASHLAELKRLFVRPADRGAGVADALLAAGLRYAKNHALHPILEVTADRVPAIRYYERTGWRRIGTSVATWQRASGEHPILHQYELA